MKKWGAVGFRYFEEQNRGHRGHAAMTFNGRSDSEIAVDALHESADVILPGLANLEHSAKRPEQHPMQYISPAERLQEK